MNSERFGALDALRVLLGAVMVVTAVQYFMPFLLPFLPKADWEDPMSTRLLTAFDKSGLLAVAKFIHIVAGVLLLTKRAVPFALTALMPVNLCGAYIAVVVEGDPLLAALALLTVALNATLMFAYLPSYRGVLEGGHVADGEGPEAGANYESLFANPLSKAPAKAYPAAALVLVAAAAFYWFVVPGLNSMTGLAVLAVPALLLAIGWVRALTRPA
ncbi:MAG: hypothetical protein H6R45_394 [Proteobacteria bacterium]|nr:hypothetical protein [Pseudomonadota bacterium]